MVMKARLYLVPPMPAHRGRSETERHYAKLAAESSDNGHSVFCTCDECHNRYQERGSVRLATIGFAILGCLIFTVLALYGARNATPKASDHYHAVKPAAVVPGVSPARVVALVNNGLHACQSAHMVDCHAEIDNDGSVGVYGSEAPTGGAYGSKSAHVPFPKQIAPLVTTPGQPGYVSTTNVPDGKCHEDDPCWKG